MFICRIVCHNEFEWMEKYQRLHCSGETENIFHFLKRFSSTFVRLGLPRLRVIVVFLRLWLRQVRHLWQVRELWQVWQVRDLRPLPRLTELRVIVVFLRLWLRQVRQVWQVRELWQVRHLWLRYSRHVRPLPRLAERRVHRREVGRRARHEQRPANNQRHGFHPRLRSRARRRRSFQNQWFRLII